MHQGQKIGVENRHIDRSIGVMGFELVRRISRGGNTIGFEIKTPDNRLINLPANAVMQLAMNNYIDNAEYTRAIKSVVQSRGKISAILKLGDYELKHGENRGKPKYRAAIQLIKHGSVQGYMITSDNRLGYVNNTQFEVLENQGLIDKESIEVCRGKDYILPANKEIQKTFCGIQPDNYNKVKEYERKRKILNINSNIDYELLPNNQVKLTFVEDTGIDETLLIPSFITKFSLIEACGVIRSSPFSQAEISSIKIDNQPGVPLNCKGLFANMESTELTVTFKHPECVTNLDYAFHMCTNLKRLALPGFTGKYLVSIENMLAGCKKLETLIAPDLSTNNLIDIRGAFLGCSSLKQIEAPNLDLSKAKLTELAFVGVDTDKFGLDTPLDSSISEIITN